MTSCDGMQASEILDRIPGLTYRKLDYWRSTGRLVAHTHQAMGATGSGVWFCWFPEEVAIAALITRLIEYGFELDAAAKTARSRERLLALKQVLDEALATVPV